MAHTKEKLGCESILELKPGSTIACKCNVHYKILRVQKERIRIRAIDLGKDGFRTNDPLWENDSMAGWFHVTDMCLPMTLVSVQMDCMFDKDIT